MVTLTELRKGITSIPSFVEEYGLSGGLNRWRGIVYNRATGTVEGRSIFEEEWDLCVILDACRADELERFRSRHDWMGTVGRYPSLGSSTWNWLPRTLEQTPDDVLADTVYVCANPFSDEFCEPDQFAELDEVWRYAWDANYGTVLPRPVTDRAIHHGRTSTASRLLVHYIQPHVPFLTDDADTLGRSNFGFDEESAPDAWDRVTQKRLPRETAISRYRETLATVLDDVDLLLSNIDATDAIVTADHGEAFGEWGLYGHPGGIDIPCLTQVPWVETTAVDEGGHTPAEYDVDGGQTSVDDRLNALGYKE